MISNLIIILSTLQLILLGIYFRLFSKKPVILLSKEEIKEYETYFECSLILRLIFCCLLSYSIYKIIINPVSEETKLGMVKKSLDWFQKLVSRCNIFYKTYDIIFNYFGTGSRYVFWTIALAKRILDYSDKKTQLIIFCFLTLPKILIILIFFIEILSGQLHYYFYSLILLVITLVFRLFIFMLNDVHERVFPEAQTMVMAEAVNIETINGRNMLHIVYKLRPEFDDVDPDTFLPTCYFPLLYIESHLRKIQEFQNKIHMPTLLIYHLCHMVGFSYILFVL